MSFRGAPRGRGGSFGGGRGGFGARGGTSTLTVTSWAYTDIHPHRPRRLPTVLWTSSSCPRSAKFLYT